MGDLKNEHDLGAFGQEEQVQMTYVRKEFGTDSEYWLVWLDVGEQERRKQG